MGGTGLFRRLSSFYELDSLALCGLVSLALGSPTAWLAWDSERRADSIESKFRNAQNGPIPELKSGMAYLQGAAETEFPEISPLTGKACALLSVTVQEEEQRMGWRRNSYDWKTKYELNKLDKPFFLKNDSGRILVVHSPFQVLGIAVTQSASSELEIVNSAEFNLLISVRRSLLSTVSKHRDHRNFMLKFAGVFACLALLIALLIRRTNRTAAFFKNPSSSATISWE